MVSGKSNGFVPEVHQRFRSFAEATDPGARLALAAKGLEEKLQRCESPIEQILLIEITRLLAEYELLRFCIIDPQIWAYYTDDFGKDAPPFGRVVGVRLDFLVCFENTWDYHIDSRHMQLVPHHWRPSLLPLFAVECDGRDFHTHEAEIQRDKTRDRTLTSLGLTTIRFTGVEIFNNARNSAREVFNLFLIHFSEILERGANRSEFVDYREVPLPATMKPDQNKPPRMVRFKQLFLSERANNALLSYDPSTITDEDARALGLLD